MRFKSLLTAVFALLPVSLVWSQTPAPIPAAAAPAAYDPRVAFAPLTLPDPVNAYRSGNGAPGPAYWQNQADYEMHAALDTNAKTLQNDETITYTNNSPDALTSLWIHLDQNIYRKDSRGYLVNGGLRRKKPVADSEENPNARTTDGYALDSVEIERGKEMLKADYLVDDTRMQIRLPQPMAPKGSVLKIHIKYHYQIPGVWGGRTSWGASQKGDIYDMAQWYPRMCVYDDLRGWDTLPYLGSEFYLEYGHFDYYVTVPSEMIVAGSGELINPKDVLTKTQVARLDQARNSDKTVMIRSADEINDPASRPKVGGTLTWHFHMDHTRDVAWSASPIFVWDAARINLPNGQKSLAESVYPPESVGEGAWGRSTEYVKDAVERFSTDWFPYPYPAAINVAGFSTGMEYPGIIFDGIDDKGKTLFWISAHEIGHTWFPMIVGSNERRNAFMDEGFNTFIDIDESAKFQGGVYGPKRDSEYSAGGEPPDTILKVLDDPAAPVLLMPADAYTWPITHPVSYFKGAYGLVLLARADPGQGPLRLGLPQVHKRLGVQAPRAFRLLPGNEQRRRRKPGLVLARLVHAQLALQSGRHQNRRGPGHLGKQGATGLTGNRRSALHGWHDNALSLACRDLAIQSGVCLAGRQTSSFGEGRSRSSAARRRPER